MTPPTPEGMNKQEWLHILPQILNSSRVVEMEFHIPKVDKDKEFITADAMAKALQDYMHLPIISEFHKERPIGVAEKAWQTGDDTFMARARIREDASVDDVWQKIKTGKYNKVSIAGRRTEYSTECNLPQSLRTTDRPCRTTGLRLDSISVCDDAARNSDTSLSVVKAASDDGQAFVYETKLVLKQVEDTLIKAETTDSNLIHPVTDGKRKGCGKGEKMKKTAPPENETEEEKKAREEAEAEEDKKCSEKKSKSEKKAESESKKETVAEQGKEGEEENQETKKAADPALSSIMDCLKTMKGTLDALVASDKKVHAGIEKAETPKEGKSDNTLEIQKAQMEQEFKKALDTALAPVIAEIDTLKKANTDLAAKIEEYGNQEIVKSGPIVMFQTDSKEKRPLGNAGAAHEQKKVKS